MTQSQITDSNSQSLGCLPACCLFNACPSLRLSRRQCYWSATQVPEALCQSKGLEEIDAKSACEGPAAVNGRCCTACIGKKKHRNR